MLTSIVAAVVILGLLIIVHEAGHFAMAKRLGVRVLRFSIGYPPRIFGIRRGETEYVIGATPVGGYVRMLGDEVSEDPKSDELHNFLVELGHDLEQAARSSANDAAIPVALKAAVGETRYERVSAANGAAIATDPDSVLEKLAFDQLKISRPFKPEERVLLNRIKIADSPADARESLQQNPPEELLDAFRARAFPTQALWKRFVIVLAGPASNLLFAPILLAIMFMYGVPLHLPYVGEVKAGMPAAQAGLQTGDKILAINHKPVATWEDFSDGVKSGKGSPVTLDIERLRGPKPGQSTVVITPRRENQPTVYGTTASEWVIGVTWRGDELTKRYNPIAASYRAVMVTGSMTVQLAVGIASIVSGSTPVREALGGPIMIAKMAGQEAHQGFAAVLMFTVMLSLELGLINLLPVPLLDGGHLAFFLFEGLRGKPLAMRHREIALQVGLFLLVALMAFVIFNDISRIVQG